MSIKNSLKRRNKMITRKGRLGLTLTATLIALWVLAPGPIPRPAVEIHFEKPNREIIERTKATWNEKLQNKKLTKRYAYLAFGWKGDERACLISLWTRESRFDHYARPLNAIRASQDQQLSELLNTLERKAEILLRKSCEALDTFLTGSTHLVEPMISKEEITGIKI
jgi:hypothetical protein